MSVCLPGSTLTILNGPILAEDKDVGPNAVVKYRLLGARVDLFNVDPDTGKRISLKKNQQKRTFKMCSAKVHISASLFKVLYLCVREQTWTVKRFRSPGWSWFWWRRTWDF